MELHAEEPAAKALSDLCGMEDALEHGCIRYRDEEWVAVCRLACGQLLGGLPLALKLAAGVIADELTAVT